MNRIFVAMSGTADGDVLEAIFTDREAVAWCDAHNERTTYRPLQAWVEEWELDPVYPDDGRKDPQPG